MAVTEAGGRSRGETPPAGRRAGGRRRRAGTLARALLAALAAQLLAPQDPAAEMISTYSSSIPAEEYGNIVMSRRAPAAGKKKVLFSHWTHRMTFVCRVCHFELGFPMVTDGVEITMEDNRAGRYCGYCHDGEEVFGTTEEDCEKCHHGSGAYEFGEKLDQLSWLPENPYGNMVDWNAALNDHSIKPIFCFNQESCGVFDADSPEVIEMVSANESVPPVVFPHNEHNLWLDCFNCHPGSVSGTVGRKPFPVQGKLRREFCSGCHMSVSFPMDNCERCHPGMDNGW